MEESNVQPVRCPVTVCGDIHGQFVRIVSLDIILHPDVISCRLLRIFVLHPMYSTTSRSSFVSVETRPTPTTFLWAIMLTEDTTLSKPSHSLLQ